jgi:hypothetical protein
MPYGIVKHNVTRTERKLDMECAPFLNVHSRPHAVTANVVSAQYTIADVMHETAQVCRTIDGH